MIISAKKALRWPLGPRRHNPLISDGFPRLATGSPRVFHGLGKTRFSANTRFSNIIYGFPRPATGFLRLFHGWNIATPPNPAEPLKNQSKRNSVNLAGRTGGNTSPQASTSWDQMAPLLQDHKVFSSTEIVINRAQVTVPQPPLIPH